MTSLGKLTVDLEARTKQLQAEFAAAAKSVKAFERATKDAEKAQDALEGSFSRGGGIKQLAASVFVAKAAFDTLFSGMSRAFALAEDAARTNTAAKFFENAGKSIEDFRKATGGLVSDADLIKKSNLAATMGITGDQFKQLAKIAEASAAKTGQSYAHMLDSIIVGTARESRLLLDNLGIIIDVTSARERYIQGLRDSGKLGDLAAKTNKELAESLTDEAEKIAFLDEAMRTGGPAIEEYAKAGQGAAQEFDKFKAATANLAQAIGTTLAGAIGSVLPLMTALINKADDLIDRFNRKGLGDKIAAMAAASGGAGVAALVAGPAAAYAGAAVGFAGGLSATDNEDPNGVRKGNDERLSRLDAALAEMTGGAVTMQDALTSDFATFQTLADQWGADVEKAMLAIRNTAKNLLVDTEFKKAADGGPSPFSKDTLEAAATKKQDAADKAAKKAADEHQKNLDSYFKDEIGYRDQWDKIYKDEDKKAAEAADAHLKSLDDYFEDEFAYREKWAKLQDEEDKRQTERAKAAREAFDSNVATGINIAASATQGDISGFTTLIASAIGAAFGAPQIGAAIGGLLGPLLEPLETLGTVFGHIVNGAGSLIKLGLEPLLNALAPLGPALELFLAMVGHLIGSALAPWIPIVTLIINALAVFIDIVSVAVAALSPLVEIASALFNMFGNLVGALVGLFTGGFSFAQAMTAAAAVVDMFTIRMAKLIVSWNNNMVQFMRNLTGDADFGNKMKLEDILVPAIVDNSDATEANTKAVRENTRELRNLPQGYKTNRALFDTMDPGRGGYEEAKRRALQRAGGGGGGGGGGRSGLETFQAQDPFQRSRQGWRDRF